MRQTMRCAAKWFAALLVMAALPGLAQAVELVRQDGTRIDVDATQLARLPQQTTSAIDHGTSRSFRGVDLRTLLAEAGIAMDKDKRGPELHTLVIVQARDGSGWCSHWPSSIPASAMPGCCWPRMPMDSHCKQPKGRCGW